MENPKSTDTLLPPTLPYYATEPPQHYILIRSASIIINIHRRRRNLCSCSASSLIALSFLVSLVILLWPFNPDIHVTNLHLDHLQIAPPPRASFDLKLRLDIEVENRNLFGLDIKSLNSSVSYRGQNLGEVVAYGGRVAAKGDSKMKAEVDINGVRVLDEVVFLMEDLAKGSVPLDTVTEVEGLLGYFFFKSPVKGKISCSLNVNPKTQKIIRQDCYRETGDHTRAGEAGWVHLN